jgi:hypothetical protein
MQRFSESSEKKFASDFLDGQISVIGKLKTVLNILLPLGFTVAQGQPPVLFVLVLSVINIPID